jgi:hypothetical protein
VAPVITTTCRSSPFSLTRIARSALV